MELLSWILRQACGAQPEAKPPLLQEGTKESTGIEQLRRTLREVVGIHTTAEEQDPQQAEEDEDLDAKVPAGQLRALREQKRPMSSFVSTSREYVNSLAIENRFRAPPPGSYRPMTHLCAPRVKTPVFTNGEPTQSRKRLLMEREAGARLCSSLTSLRLKGL
ncbi:CA14 [Symbiodinium necroappetens]|uniref:CA14 protein n=1 Tax=Symbiodinium necroappetens TaxID=1628268 RepID=A0A812YTA5_9DINO|nr:CA14 [Symbiodinium necroappetens]